MQIQFTIAGIYAEAWVRGCKNPSQVQSKLRPTQPIISLVPFTKCCFFLKKKKRERKTRKLTVCRNIWWIEIQRRHLACVKKQKNGFIFIDKDKATQTSPFIKHPFHRLGREYLCGVCLTWHPPPPPPLPGQSMGGRRHPASGGVDGLCNKNTWREPRKRRLAAGKQQRQRGDWFRLTPLYSHGRGFLKKI